MFRSSIKEKEYRQRQTLLNHQVYSSYGVWDLRLKRSALDRACRGPEPARIDPMRIEREHLVVELSRRRRCLGEPVEIADVLPGLFDDPGAVVVARSLMAGDHRAWLERLDGIERSDPLAALLRV